MSTPASWWLRCCSCSRRTPRNPSRCTSTAQVHCRILPSGYILTDRNCFNASLCVQRFGFCRSYKVARVPHEQCSCGLWTTHTLTRTRMHTHTHMHMHMHTHMHTHTHHTPIHAHTHTHTRRWLNNRRTRHLRHDAVHHGSGLHLVCGAGLQHGGVPGGGRQRGHETLPPPRQDHDTPAARDRRGGCGLGSDWLPAAWDCQGGCGLGSDWLPAARDRRGGCGLGSRYTSRMGPPGWVWPRIRLVTSRTGPPGWVWPRIRLVTSRTGPPGWVWPRIRGTTLASLVSVVVSVWESDWLPFVWERDDYM